MKKIDILLALITGEGVAWLFVWLLKNSALELPYLNWLLPIFFPFLTLFCLWISYLVGKKYLFVFQLAKFILIGSIFALFDLVILNSLMVWLGVTKGLGYSILVTISFLIATIIKYTGNKFWAFEKVGGKVGEELSKFFVITLISGVIQVAIASLLVNTVEPLFGMQAIVWANVGKILGIIVASAWNFLGYKFIVFKK